MTGLADFPSIAGRTASYTMRQLWDFKQGTRQSAIMAPVVAQLTAEDMLYISVYLASLEGTARRTTRPRPTAPLFVVRRRH